MYKKISAVLLWSEDYSRLAGWYQDKFGFETIEELNHPKDTGIGLRVGESYLWIGNHSEVHGLNRDPFRIMFNISVDSVEKSYQDLLNRGVHFIAKPFKAPLSESYFATLEDLDGNILQLIGPQ